MSCLIKYLSSGYKGVYVKKYEILDVNNQDYLCSVRVKEVENDKFELGNVTFSGVKRTVKNIDFPICASGKLKVGQNIFVLQSKLSKDYVYLYRDGVYFNIQPASDDRYSCKYYLRNLPGVCDHRFDRAVLKAVLLCECRRRGIFPSLIARRNLQKLFLRKGLVVPEK